MAVRMLRTAAPTHAEACSRRAEGIRVHGLSRGLRPHDLPEVAIAGTPMKILATKRYSAAYVRRELEKGDLHSPAAGRDTAPRGDTSVELTGRA